ncbi:MAG: trypsin-like peptidase domain-containing protein [Micavibrio aeruginosavorus]|uniref:Trypsin-like peptidase domain-containing protein n=1 Tax=Micavibrio aeruginosavorus TaxID=349221 RepID=A0A7T5UH47_9BACT|nr:MAG: trypsin-like peptidase domain-containing protein [Micavibrio aeruginosavorus]
MIIRFVLPVILLLGLCSGTARAEDRASRIFKDTIPGVFQIAVVDKRTQEKETIGSGFRVESASAMQFLATNYHVISDYTRYTDRYDIEYRAEEGQSGKLKLVAIDVVNDLAVLVSSEGKMPGEKVLALSRERQSKGQKVFAIGNPHDKGMIVIEGAYGGEIKNEFFDHIIFSGTSLNPGMSGGPAVDESGQVIGINVAIAANDINYLVPAASLGALLERAGKEDRSLKRTSNQWRDMAVEQVLTRQKRGIDALMKVTPEIAELNEFSYPKNLDQSFKCWGGGFKRDKNHNFNMTWVSCDQETDIYLKPYLNTGKIKYALAYLEGSKIPRTGFDVEYSEYYGASWLVEDKNEIDVHEFSCESGFTRHAGDNWKSAFCARAYKGYPGLYDVYFSSAILGHPNKGYYYKASIEGVDIQTAKSFLGKIAENVTWKE